MCRWQWNTDADSRTPVGLLGNERSPRVAPKCNALISINLSRAASDLSEYSKLVRFGQGFCARPRSSNGKLPTRSHSPSDDLRNPFPDWSAPDRVSKGVGATFGNRFGKLAGIIAERTAQVHRSACSGRFGRRVTWWRRLPGEAGPCRRHDAGSRSEGRRCRLAPASRHRSRWAPDQLRLPHGRNPRAQMEHRASDGRQALFSAGSGRCAVPLAPPAKKLGWLLGVTRRMRAACKNMPTRTVGASPPGSPPGGRSMALRRAPGHVVAPAAWRSGAVPTA
jgi:hypothetical protein